MIVNPVTVPPLTVAVAVALETGGAIETRGTPV